MLKVLYVIVLVLYKVDIRVKSDMICVFFILDFNIMKEIID